jgi:predicted nucleic acid-binding protein
VDARSHGKEIPSVVIVDSSVLIDYLADRTTPETNWLEQNLDRRRIGITTMILTEVLQGIRGDDQFAETLEALGRFALFEIAGRELAVRSARNYRALRKRGITIRNAIDCLNATFCIHEGHALLHNDRDFDPFEEHLDLEVLHPEPVK